MQLDFTGFQPRHLRGLFDKMVQPVALFIDDAQQFVTLRNGHLPAGKEAGHRRFHGGQRCAEIMRDGIQQCGLQPLSLPLSFRQAELFYSSRPFDGDGHQAAHRVERLPRESCSGNTEAPDGPHTKTHWNKVKTLLRFNGHFIAEERRLHFLCIEMSSAIPRPPKLLELRGAASAQRWSDSQEVHGGTETRYRRRWRWIVQSQTSDRREIPALVYSNAGLRSVAEKIVLCQKSPKTGWRLPLLKSRAAFSSFSLAMPRVSARPLAC